MVQLWHTHTHAEGENSRVALPFKRSTDENKGEEREREREELKEWKKGEVSGKTTCCKTPHRKKKETFCSIV